MHHVLQVASGEERWLVTQKTARSSRTIDVAYVGYKFLLNRLLVQ